MLVIAGMAEPAASAETKGVLAVTTGSKGAVYYPTGQALCRILKAHAPKLPPCDVRESQGSVTNIERLRNGEANLAIVQSDVHFHALNGDGRFKSKGPYKDLRSLFSLHAEPFTVVARAGSGIWKLPHLRGKRINVGRKGSGPRDTFLELMVAMGWDASTFSGFTQFGVSDQAAALCGGSTDVITFVVGHPADSIRQATKRCNAVLVNIAGDGIKRLMASRPYYSTVRIPAGIYRGVNSDVRTFGVRATLVTTAGLNADTAHSITQAVMDHLSKFRSMHPALKYLNKADMATMGLTAPPHAGAERYFKAAGLR